MSIENEKKYLYIYVYTYTAARAMSMLKKIKTLARLYFKRKRNRLKGQYVGDSVRFFTTISAHEKNPHARNRNEITAIIKLIFFIVNTPFS